MSTSSTRRARAAPRPHTRHRPAPASPPHGPFPPPNTQAFTPLQVTSWTRALLLPCYPANRPATLLQVTSWTLPLLTDDEPEGLVAGASASDALPSQSSTDGPAAAPAACGGGGAPSGLPAAEADPGCDVAAHPSLPAAASPLPSPLPSGWEERVDVASGRPFYVDFVNRQTSWARPTREAAAPPAAGTSAAARDPTGVGAEGSAALPAAGYPLPAAPHRTGLETERASVDEDTVAALGVTEQMWGRMRLREREPPPPAPPPPAGYDRDAMRRQRAAQRAAAVANVERTRREGEGLMRRLGGAAPPGSQC